MRDLLRNEFGYERDPDLYALQLYNANSTDMLNALTQMAQPGSGNEAQLKLDRVFVSEFATSSSIDNRQGFNIPTWGDNNVPTGDEADQAQWLRNTLCAFQRLNITKMAYWALYDPYSMWNGPPWFKTGDDLAWNGFWGLAYEGVAFGNKQSWPVLRDYYYTGSLSCAATQGQSPVLLSLTPSTNYYTVNQEIRISWTAGDFGPQVAFSCTNGACAPAQRWACNTQTSIEPLYSYDNSCGDTDLTPTTTVGPRNLSVTARNNTGGGDRTVTKTVQIGATPIVLGIQPDWGVGIYPDSYVTISGQGFARTGNQIIFRKGAQTEIFTCSGPTYCVDSHTSVNMDLANRLSSGNWTVEVNNMYPPTPSSPAVGFTVQ